MTVREEIEQDAALAVGQTVTVRWGYGSGFRAQGQGIITRLYDKSVRVRLTADVPSVTRAGEIGWPAGFELRGIPRACDWQRWHPEHCVVPA